MAVVDILSPSSGIQDRSGADAARSASRRRGWLGSCFSAGSRSWPASSPSAPEIVIAVDHQHMIFVLLASHGFDESRNHRGSSPVCPLPYRRGRLHAMS